MFAGRIVAFDLACTRAYAELTETMREAGRAIAHTDGYIAAVAAAHGFTVATRDTGPFAAVGLRVIDPWTA